MKKPIVITLALLMLFTFPTYTFAVDSTPPQFSNLNPPPSTPPTIPTEIFDPTPTILAAIMDMESGVNIATIHLYLNGTEIPFTIHYSYGITEFFIEHQVTSPLNEATYIIQITASNMDGFTSSTSWAFKVVSTEPIEVEANVGALYFLNEIVEWQVLTSIRGVPTDVSAFTIGLVKPSSVMALVSLPTYRLGKGLYRFGPISLNNATAPFTALTFGLYTIAINATYRQHFGSTIASFQLSKGFTGMKATLESIDGTVWQVKLDTGKIKLNMTNVLTNLTYIKGQIVQINTKLGVINATLQKINASISGIHADVLKLDTIVGKMNVTARDLNATVTKFKVDTATISTTLGNIETNVGNINVKVSDIEGDIAVLKTSLGDINGTIVDVQNQTALVITEKGYVKADLTDFLEENPQYTFSASATEEGTPEEEKQPSAPFNWTPFYWLLIAVPITLIAIITVIILVRRKPRLALPAAPRYPPPYAPPTPPQRGQYVQLADGRIVFIPEVEAPPAKAEETPKTEGTMRPTSNIKTGLAETLDTFKSDVAEIADLRRQAVEIKNKITGVQERVKAKILKTTEELKGGAEELNKLFEWSNKTLEEELAEQRKEQGTS